MNFRWKRGVWKCYSGDNRLNDDVFVDVSYE